ncbi:DegQ family serine endoprotease [Agrobacterium vitis]|uniref:DegQ family serine endoprotease n=2 Tax=Agrobacterium vitis TaxID=373 RepID=A0A109CW48_AGRVI|nr:DegQ family serine endoprotease [Agrobacterium vitis]KAA3510260.1 DegQ family serine endoprotease [Agrobacterium vitis]KAA3526677.1 DegQ family serine endoprotease [Agrobacterium vitis]MCE6073476.1 Do family serine endopeptidase [Agrobacterium vitis]MCF1453492.1 DegQ family serine endoprotease [Agrobacterium vitis]MCF1468284.1 DegQ family serine endoprotease [Agrobacterium vitis]
MRGLKSMSPAVIVLACLAGSPVLAQDAKSLPQSRADMQMSFAPLVKQTHGAVVNVYAERIVQSRVNPFAGDPFFQQFFGQRFPNRTERQTSLGSGVIVEANGTVMTNFHVIAGADDIKVSLSDGREYPVKVVLKDERLDLAVLKIDAKESLPTLKIADSDKIEVGDLVLAIGNPFGVGQTVTSGIVSGLARNQVSEGDFGFFIQTDASINPGNSGGALMNMNGELIGLNTAIFSKGGGSNGVGFAIPANLVKVFLEAADKGASSFERPYVGATFEPVTSDVADALGLKQVLGALVTKTVEGGPADKAGIKAGQVITAVDGVIVEHPDALNYRLTTIGLGKSVTLNVIDNGKPKDITLTLAGAPETRPRDEQVIKNNSPFEGATVGNLSPRLAFELKLNTQTTGVAITALADGSVAQRLGFQLGDIIVSINGTEVTSSRDMVQIAKSSPAYWRIEIDRNGQRIRQMFR